MMLTPSELQDFTRSVDRGCKKLEMRYKPFYLSGLLAVLGLMHTPLHATVTILSMTPSHASPRPLGTTVAWTVTATDTGSGPLTFQFNTAYGKGAFSTVWDFNTGTLASGIWTSRVFLWDTIAGEGAYQMQVVAKDFASGETATQAANFRLSSRVINGQPAVNLTANPLVALFSAPSCAAGSTIQVSFAASGGSPSYTNWNPCLTGVSMNFYVAGMLPGTTYSMNYQVNTGGTIQPGATPLSFTTGALPAYLVPTFSVVTPPGAQTDTTDSTVLHGTASRAPGNGPSLFSVPIATDLAGNITWYYKPTDVATLTRPVAGGYMLTLQDGAAWNPALTRDQYVREIDLAGNTVRETNTGIISQQLVAMGASDAMQCNQVPSPPPVGTACLNFFNHEAMRLPNGYTAILARVEKLFQSGTQGSTTGQPVDIMGNMTIVLDTNWQAVWYFEDFQHLNINRPAVLGETCGNGGATCGLKLALANEANDWTHTNSIYYLASSGDLLISMRNQDWLMKINYNNGTGDGSILWTMGIDGDFTFNNLNNDPFPWFSHQHDAEYQSNGALTVFDNGNTRVSPAPIGLGRPGYSRGMALTVDETNMQVTPILSQALGYYSSALGSAALQSNGNYFFQPGTPASYAIQILPTPGTIAGTQVYDLACSAASYRAFQMPNLYTAPTN